MYRINPIILKDSLTILVPVYNEEDCLWEFKKDMDLLLARITIPTQVLFINDGSRDSSLEVICQICEHENYTYLSLDQNHGLSTALKAGIDQVDTTYTGYIDADLQTNPLDFLKYLPFFEHYEMINGIRKNRQDSWSKRLTSRVGNGLRKWIIKDGIQDTCCPLKVMHTSMIKEIPLFKGMHRFLPALVQVYGGKVKQIEVQHHKRFAGQSKYNLGNRLFRSILDMLAFLWIRKRVINYKEV